MTTALGEGGRFTRHAARHTHIPKRKIVLRHHAMARALAMALAAGTGGLLATPAMSHPAPASQPSTQTRSYHIPAGPLGQALDTLGAQGNIQVVYAPKLVAEKTSPGLSGHFTPRQALQHLLRGTGLTWKSIGAATFVLKPGHPDNHDPRPQSRKTSSHDTTQAAQEKARALAPVTVSGSLINNAQIQTATPTFTITSQQIEELGFDNVEQTLQNSVLAVGAVQGEASSGSFTQGAQTFSLNQLPPGFTLVLVDGRPLAPFGELYNGTSTFHNISNLPSSMVDHIDIMPGGASSIYGSSAMAGVVNIVTKSHMNGMELSGEVKGYARGGHSERKVTLTFGHDFGKLDVLGSLHYSNRSPLWAYQRDLTRSTANNPVPPAVPKAVAEIFGYGFSPDPHSHTQRYVSPPNGCGAMSHLYHGTILESGNPDDPDRPGTYCGTYFEEAYRTLSSKTQHYDGLLKLKYKLNPHTRLYADLMANYEKKRYVSSPPHWDTDHFPGAVDDKIEDAATGEVLRFYKRFAPEELPGGIFGPARAYSQNNLLSNIDVGANGSFGNSDWLWNVYYQHASDRTRYNKPLWLASVVNGFFQKKFMGPKVGVDPDTGYSMYNIDYNAFFTPVTAAQSKAMIYNNHGIAKSWVNNTRLVINNPYWFELPGGHAGFAALMEFGGQAWYEPVDPNMAAGLVWGHAATAGGGRRQHQGMAFELNLPVLKMVTLDLSGREDRYKIKTADAKKKFTWKAGIEFRPIDTLLIRGNYATSFKAPDMAGVFLGPSTSFSNETDYYQCDLAEAAGTASNCDGFEVDILKTHKGNPDLKPTTAKSWTTGVVWAPTPALSFNVDYLHIAIANQTVLESADELLLNESRCRRGLLDMNLPHCQEALSQIKRDVSGTITGITAFYANRAKQTVNSITAGWHYRLHTDHLGSFHFRLAYNDILKHTKQDRPTSDVEDTLHDPEHVDGFKSTTRGSISWHTPTEHHCMSRFTGIVTARFPTTPRGITAGIVRGPGDSRRSIPTI